MAADVQERTQRVLTIADDDDGDVADRGCEERARLGDVALVADVLPRALEDALALELEHGRIRVPAPRKRSRADGAHAGTLPADRPETWVGSRPDERAGRRSRRRDRRCRGGHRRGDARAARASRRGSDHPRQRRARPGAHGGGVSGDRRARASGHTHGRGATAVAPARGAVRLGRQRQAQRGRRLAGCRNRRPFARSERPRRRRRPRVREALDDTAVLGDTRRRLALRPRLG